MLSYYVTIIIVLFAIVKSFEFPLGNYQLFCIESRDPKTQYPGFNNRHICHYFYESDQSN